MALRRAWIGSRNYSSRGGGKVRLVVLHTAEGARTYQSLGSFFQGNVQASSHVGIDDTRGTIGEYVRRGDKAWTQSNYNPVAVSVELCAFAKWDRAEWMRHPNMLANCADWIREECAYFGVPITRLSAAQAQGSGRGVCQHVDLGAGGGGHWDCGPGFPMDHVLEMARGGAPGPGPTPEPEPTEVDDMMTSALAADGTLHVWTVGPARQTAWLTFQKPNTTAWWGGEAGKKIAGFFKFADAPKGRTIRGLTASVAAGGSLHFFMTLDNGDVHYRYQPKGKTDWSDLAKFAPWG